MPRYSDAVSDEIDHISNDLSSQWDFQDPYLGSNPSAVSASLSNTPSGYLASDTPSWVDDPNYQGGGYYLDKWGNKGAAGTSTWQPAQPLQRTEATVPGYQPAPLPQPLSLGQWQSQYDNPNNGQPLNLDYYSVNNPRPEPDFNQKLVAAQFQPQDSFNRRMAEEQNAPGSGLGLMHQIRTLTSGEQFQKDLGIDTSYIDSLRSHGLLGDVAATGIDVLSAPVTIASAGLAGAAGGGTALAGDIAANLGAAYGGQAASSKAAESIPIFGDQPAWLRGLEGQAVFGVGGGYAGSKFPGLTRGIAEDVAPAAQAFHAGEAGQGPAVSLGDIGNAAKSVGQFAAPVLAKSAVGGGIGAAYGAATGNDIGKSAAIGAGIGAGVGLAGKGIARLAERNLPETVAAERPQGVDKLTELIKKAAPIREDQEALYSAERGRRAGIATSIVNKSGDFRTGMRESTSALAGPLPRARAFEGVEHQMTPEDVSGLFNHIQEKIPESRYYDRKNVTEALEKTLTGELPTRGEIAALGKVFGDDFANALLSRRSLGQKAWEATVDALNLPRTLMTSWDASAPLRQGALSSIRHPLSAIDATGAMVKAMASPKYADAVMEGIEKSPNKALYDKMGLYFADMTKSGELSAREEAFVSKLASNLPGVSGSQRGYTTYLNKLRQDIADGFLKAHPDLSGQELRDFGHVINISTGRGDLPKILTNNTALLNSAFAPRYAMSRLQLPGEFVKALAGVVTGGRVGMTSAASKELASQVMALVGAGTAVLVAGQKSGLWTVELNPLSTDFGKGKMGNTRFDFWAGEQQMARYAAQLALGKRKTSTGNVVDANRLDIVGRWLNTKTSPAVGLAHDVLSGQDFVGDKVDFTSKEGIGKQLYQRFVPLFVQDMSDAANTSGNQWKALTALPSGAGAGVQSYEDSDALKRQNWIRDNQALFNDPSLVMPGKKPDSYGNLSPKGKRLVNEQYGKPDPFGNEAKAYANAVSTLTDQQQASDQRRASGSLSPEQWRSDYTDRKTELAIRRDQIYANSPGQSKDPVLAPYYATIDAAKGPDGKIDWDKVDSYVAGLPTAQQNYISNNTGLVVLDTPATEQFKQTYDAIKNSGYFARSDQNWQQVAALVPTWDKLGTPVNPSDYSSYDAWRQAALKASLDLAGKTTEDIATVTQINSWLDKQEPVKGMDYYGAQWKDQWVADHPKEAYDAWKYGYYNPKKEIKAWLAQQFEN